MAIYGIGTDLVQIHRVALLWERFGEKLARRILADVEWPAFQAQLSPAAFLAKRFAAKEAVAKALGIGLGAQLAFKEIAVTHTPQGQPQICLLGKAESLLKPHHHIHISISDERDMAIAFVVIEQHG